MIAGAYEEPRRGDYVGHLVDPAAGTEYDDTGVVMHVRRAPDGAPQVRVRWDYCAGWVDERWLDADELIVIREAPA